MCDFHQTELVSWSGPSKARATECAERTKESLDLRSVCPKGKRGPIRGLWMTGSRSVVPVQIDSSGISDHRVANFGFESPVAWKVRLARSGPFCLTPPGLAIGTAISAGAVGRGNAEFALFGFRLRTLFRPEETAGIVQMIKTSLLSLSKAGRLMIVW